MGAPRRKAPLASRRRTDDDGEENASNITGQEDDVSSLGSGPSEGEIDADADGEASDGSDAIVHKRAGPKKSNGNGVHRGNEVQNRVSPSKPTAFASTLTDTELMMNALQVPDHLDEEEETIHFDRPTETEAVGVQPVMDHQEPTQSKVESLAEKRKREHEEYKKKRDEDPAFVPNRGGFFMHDQRRTEPAQNGFRISGRGRNRGRGGFGLTTPFSPYTASSSASDAFWAHDLHESVADAEPAKVETSKPNIGISPIHHQKVTAPTVRTPPPNRSFSRSTHVGNVQLRVFLEGMKDAVVFSGVPVNQHTRLPHHRPPLRRDKPVRISLPDFPPRYIFPAMDRSFIFIPRAMRPNQQGFGRGRGRGSFSAYGGLASARNSVFGGSAYTPSIAMSRRSSIARDLGRDAMASPAGSVMSRNRGLLMDVNRPVVRLPPSVDFSAVPNQPQSLQHTSSPAPVVNLPQAQVYAAQEWPSNLPMHQPRPQKQVSVAEIESPSALNFPPPQQQQQQPFHQQVPAALNGQALAHDASLNSHSRHPSHPSQRGTPLSQIPERAIHAQPFQPYPFQQPQSFYPQQYPTPIYYYASPPPPSSIPPSSVSNATFVPGQQYSYVLPTAPMAAPTEAANQAGTVAHESNGMVYYYDSSQLASNPEDPTTYQNLGFVPSTTYVMPHGAVYYPTQ